MAGIEKFCLLAKHKQQTLDNLYKQLEAPPIGVKRGVIPVLLAAVLLYHIDDVGVYKDGTFIPVLGAEHFELLLKTLPGLQLNILKWWECDRKSSKNWKRYCDRPTLKCHRELEIPHC